MRRIICTACWIVSLVVVVPLFGETRRVEPLTETPVTPPYQRPLNVTRPYQHTWYDGLLRQFNPDNLDWGHWLEQRRQALLNQTAANPYFKYSLITTVLLVVLALALAKALIDKSRVKWLAQERHEDLLKHDAQARQAAREAIRKYNEHMEKCNRVVEAEVGGRTITAPTPGVLKDSLTLDQALANFAAMKRERDELAGKLEETTAIIGDLTMRINNVSTAGNRSSHVGPAQADLVKRNNDLREQLYRERERNKQLKGM
jgi:hypothetical protein